ncbi:hypothetical protein ACJX0J_021322, partial [Zea mays]
MEHINNNIERYKAKLNPFGFYRLFYDCFLRATCQHTLWHKEHHFTTSFYLINKKTLFFASNINQFDLYSSLVDNLDIIVLAEVSQVLRLLETAPFGQLNIMHATERLYRNKNLNKGFKNIIISGKLDHKNLFFQW